MADNLTSKVEIETSSAEKNIEELGRKFQGVFKTMQDVAQRLNISDRIGPVLDSIPGKLATIREGASNVKDKFEELVSTAEKNAKSFERLATVGVGAVSGIVVGLALLIVRASETDDRLSRLAEAVGTTKEKMAGLSAAAEISGAGLETLERVLIRTTEAAREQVLSDRQLRFAKDDLGREYQKTTRTINEQLKATGDTVAFEKSYSAAIRDNIEAQLKLQREHNRSITGFEKYGVAIRNADGSMRDGIDVMHDFADVIKNLPEGVGRTNAVIETLHVRSTEAAKAVRLLSQGSAELKAQAALALAIAPPLLEKSEEDAHNFWVELKTLKAVYTSLQDELGVAFAPNFTEFLTIATNLIGINRQAAINWAKEIASKLTPVLEDLKALLSGETPTKGGFIETADRAIRAFGVGVDITFNHIVVPAFKALLAVADLVAGVLNKVFGTEISGGALLTVLLILKLVGAFGLVEGAIGLVVSAMRPLVAIFSLPGVALAALIVALGVMVVSALGGTETIKNAWNVLVEFWTGNNASKLKDAWDKLMKSMAPGAQEFVDTVKKSWAELEAGPSVLNLGGNTKREVDGIKNFFRDIQAGWKDLEGKSANAINFVNGLWISFKASVASAAASIGVAFDAQWKSFLAGIDDAIVSAQDKWTTFKTAFAGLVTGISEFFDGEWTKFKASLNTLITDALELWRSFVERLGSIASSIAAPFVTAWEELRAGVQSVVDAFNSAFDSAVSFVQSKVQSIIAAVRSAIEWMRNLVGSATSTIGGDTGAAGGGAVSSLAGGGRVRGPGTSKSDSIGPVWLSNEEWVIQADAVRHYGQAFMAAVNGMRFPRSGFSMGGMIGSGVAPVRLATGGPVSPGRPIDLTIFGETFRGLTAPQDVASDLVAFATHQQYTRAGRKPLWVR
jgi:ElaB/YqjD/DUF883 family membrane-anchored ribosome-binding protein